MPRKARIKSQQHIYHAILRGINKQQIFYEESDFRNFEMLLNRYKDKCDFQLPAYCLMGNHIHLLIRENSLPISNIFKHIGSAFVYWYNIKYERTGHLFQDRFMSEPVDNEIYLLNVFRYILNNPVKAGICENPEDYPYSSAREYLLGKAGITDKDMITNLMDHNSIKEYISRENDDQCLEFTETAGTRYTDEKAINLIHAEFRSGIPIIEKNTKSAVNSSIRKLIRSGISIRQLSRLTGISKKIIEYAIKQ